MPQRADFLTIFSITISRLLLRIFLPKNPGTLRPTLESNPGLHAQESIGRPEAVAEYWPSFYGQ